MTITPTQLRQLADKLENKDIVTASEICTAQQEAITQFQREAIEAVNKLAEELMSKIQAKYPSFTDHVRINIPTAIDAKRVEREMKRWVEANMTDEERTRQARRKKATKGVTHRITKEINHPRYDHLRKAGFCAGMKFRIVSRHSLNRVVVEHIRSGKRAIMSTTLLETIPDGQF